MFKFAHKVPKGPHEWKLRFAFIPTRVGMKNDGHYVTIWLCFYEVRDYPGVRKFPGLEYRLPGSENTVVFDDWRVGAW
jgi:hypothetical protein